MAFGKLSLDHNKSAQRGRLGAQIDMFVVKLYGFKYCIYCVLEPSLHRQSTDSTFLSLSIDKSLQVQIEFFPYFSVGVFMHVLWYQKSQHMHKLTGKHSDNLSVAKRYLYKATNVASLVSSQQKQTVVRITLQVCPRKVSPQGQATSK